MNKSISTIVTALSILTFIAPAVSSAAGALSQQDEEVLKEVQSVLTQKDRRQSEGLTTSDAKQLDQRIDRLTGGNQADKEKIYQISAQVMDRLIHESNGDITKLTQIIQEAMKNPQAFIDKMTPSERAQVKAVSADIEKRNPAAAAQNHP